MQDEQKQIEEMAKVMCEEYDTDICKHECPTATDCANILIAKGLIAAGYRKASEVIGEFVEKVNLVECEMFHKAHDIRNASEEKLDRCNWKDDLQWGEYKKQEGKMIALQDFMTKIERIAAEYGVEVEE